MYKVLQFHDLGMKYVSYTQILTPLYKVLVATIWVEEACYTQIGLHKVPVIDLGMDPEINAPGTQRATIFCFPTPPKLVRGALLLTGKGNLRRGSVEAWS